MRRYRRQMNLSEVKNSFHQSGYVDWHLNPRLGDSQEDHEGGGCANSPARIEAATALCCCFNE